ncbi:MAG: hypothetical protein ACP5VS_06230, partial [Desulfomonilaceae bacterium]
MTRKHLFRNVESILKISNKITQNAFHVNRHVTVNLYIKFLLKILMNRGEIKWKSLLVKQSLRW